MFLTRSVTSCIHSVRIYLHWTTPTAVCKCVSRLNWTFPLANVRCWTVFLRHRLCTRNGTKFPKKLPDLIDDLSGGYVELKCRWIPGAKIPVYTWSEKSDGYVEQKCGFDEVGYSTSVGLLK